MGSVPDCSRPGYIALQDLKKKHEESNPLVAAKIHRLYTKYSEEGTGITQEQFFSSMQVYSGRVPEELKTTIFDRISKAPYRIARTKAFGIREIHLNKDTQPEYLFIQEKDYSTKLELFVLQNDKWVATDIESQRYGKLEAESTQALKDGNFEIVEPEWMELKLGGRTYQVRPLGTDPD